MSSRRSGREADAFRGSRARGPRKRVRAAVRHRLDPEVFELPVEKIRDGYYTDAYFNHTRSSLLADGRHPRVLLQVFQKKEAVLGGMDEAVAILKLCSHGYDDPSVRRAARRRPDRAVGDGAHGRGRLHALLPPRDRLPRSARAQDADLDERAPRRRGGEREGDPLLPGAARPPSRADRRRLRGARRGRDRRLDGRAGLVVGRQGIGTVPHGLIAAYGGDTVLAATTFAEWAPEDMNVVVLVDFENDSVRTSLEVARALGPRLWGVRLDTSGDLRRPRALGRAGRLRPRGVNERPVQRVRGARRGGFEAVKIVVSGGFGVEKIRRFEELGVPADAYGVGSSLIRGENDFTADVVVADGSPPRRSGAARRTSGSSASADGCRCERAGPRSDWLRRADDVRSRLLEAGEGGVRIAGVVDPRHDDRRRAVLEQVQARRDLGNVQKQVGDRPRDAVALRLTGDEDGVEAEQVLDERRVPRPERLARRPRRTSGPSTE